MAADEDDGELAAALAMSLADPLALPEDVAVSSATNPAPPQSLEERIMEICGCTRSEASRAAVAAGPGGLTLAVELLVSGSDLPAPAHAPRRTKLVCLVRQDLGMGVGKVAAQVAHGALGAHREAGRRQPDMLREWCDGGEATVVLAVSGADELERLVDVARAGGLPTHLVRDAGRTQVEAGSLTVGCIGPGLVDAIDQVTGKLSLL